METSTAKSAAEEALSGAERGPESPRIEATWPQAINPQPGNPQPERRRLVRNLRSSALFAKIREAERRMEAGERELGFYLLDLKRRHVYRDAKCTSFSNYIRTKTGLKVEKANEWSGSRRPSSSSRSRMRPSTGASFSGLRSGS